MSRRTPKSSSTSVRCTTSPETLRPSSPNPPRAKDGAFRASARPHWRADMNHPNRSRRKNAPVNLVESAYQLLLDLQIVRSFAEFGREVSGPLNRKDSMQRWNDWRHGRLPIPRDVQTYLLDLALGH